jgi:manganese/zinc/iron transport system permease protein
METLRTFFSFSDPNIVSVVVGAVLLTASSAIVGTFTFLKKKALLGDAVAHSVLPGVCAAFLWSGTKDPLVMITGAFLSGWLAVVLMDKIVAGTKIKEDTAIALVLSVFFGFGILLLTYIQHSGNAAQTGLESFLFGKAAALVGTDLLIFAVVALILMLTVGLFFKELRLIAFDEPYASAIGLPVKRLNLLLTSLTVMAVVTGIQAVGVVLMSAMLITPAAAARYWTDRVHKMVWIAAFFGAFSGFSGAFVSYVAPAMPTGPWIVVVVSVLAIASFFFAPGRGIMARQAQQRVLQRSILSENVLKALYHMGEAGSDFLNPRSLAEFKNRRSFPEGSLLKALRRLKYAGLVRPVGQKWQLTEAGLVKGRDIVKKHRLWELYLLKHLQIDADHVHDDAETIEHILTPELEAELMRLMDYPDRDPHEAEIPYGDPKN